MVTQAVTNALTSFGMALIKPITDLISEVVEDKDKANELAFKIATLASSQAHQNHLAQIGVNQTEAAHKHLFVAGWRPFIGWICGIAMGFNYLVAPLMGAFGWEINALDIATIFPVLLGILGMSGMRTFEKMQGVAREK